MGLGACTTSPGRAPEAPPVLERRSSTAGSWDSRYASLAPTPSGSSTSSRRATRAFPASATDTNRCKPSASPTTSWATLGSAPSNGAQSEGNDRRVGRGAAPGDVAISSASGEGGAIPNTDRGSRPPAAERRTPGRPRNVEPGDGRLRVADTAAEKQCSC